ncbi:MAG: NUDIX hydrolase [Proteobacteria bacterium]|nr:NUDIX hydrolase [Pseudomonadota bacterium]MBU1737539.1 NUDIX hydrolase [Pseudomonadota bacterium]
MNCPECGHQIKEFPHPAPTVDVIIENGSGIVLVKRKNPPYGWALPGGFVDYGESLEKAAVREAFEETGLSVELVCQLHTYSNPDRDPRRHTITTVFLARAAGNPVAGDDAAEAVVYPLEKLPELVFDHKEIIHDYTVARKKLG